MQPGTGEDLNNDVAKESNIQDTNQQHIVKDAIDETMAPTSPVENAVFKVVRRNGKVTPFDKSKIEVRRHCCSFFTNS